MRYSGGKFRLGAVFEVNQPDVPPPLGLAVAAALCILPLVALLVLGIAQLLSQHADSMYSAKESLILAVVAGVLPMLTIHSITTNRSMSRWLLLSLVCGLLLLSLRWIDLFNTAPSFGLAAFLLLAIGWWLFRSPRMRVYYALISGNEIPQDLSHIELRTRTEEAIVSWLGDLVPYLEGLVVLLVIAAVVYGIINTV